MGRRLRSADGDIVDGSAGATREVFTLKVYEDGDWEYHLNDQVDHSGDDDDDDLTLSNGQEALQFTSLVEVTDADDDTVNLGTLGRRDRAVQYLDRKRYP